VAVLIAAGRVAMVLVARGCALAVMVLILIMAVSMHVPVGLASGERHHGRQQTEQGRKSLPGHVWSSMPSA
jgi:hypothetical protein